MTELKVVSAFHHFIAKDSNLATKIHNCFVNVGKTIQTWTVKICRRILLWLHYMYAKNQYYSCSNF